MYLSYLMRTMLTADTLSLSDEPNIAVLAVGVGPDRGPYGRQDRRDIGRGPYGRQYRRGIGWSYEEDPTKGDLVLVVLDEDEVELALAQLPRPVLPSRETFTTLTRPAMHQS